MARVVVLGAGISGHAAASHLREWLEQGHEVFVVSPNARWNWIPSNIWVGIGAMSEEDVSFELAPVYAKTGILFKQAKALSLNPEGDSSTDKPFVTIEHTSSEFLGKIEQLHYDYLVNATGPKLEFGATKGLGEGSNLGEYTYSVCTAHHAKNAAEALQKAIALMKQGRRQKFLIGTGHRLCTCQGAAFEYIFNVEHELKKAGVREMADIKWISNEPFLGDFGMGGIHMRSGGHVVSSKIFAESLFRERHLKWIIGASVYEIGEGYLDYELLDGSKGREEFDFAMLLPPFMGAGLDVYAKDGSDISEQIFTPSGFMRVDANYEVLSYEHWRASDWPSTYQNPLYANLFACGIAFAPPHGISKPMHAPSGTLITPMPPRTGMPSAIIGKAVARSIVDLIEKGAKAALQNASMADMGAGCIASTGKGALSGTAVTMAMYPVVPDYERYPSVGRDLEYTFAEIGLAGHWTKYLLHHLFLYKAKLKLFWQKIPE